LIDGQVTKPPVNLLPRRLGIKFSAEVDGTLSVVALDEGGSVASAGGQIGDIWVTVHGVPAAEVRAEWQDGTRQRRPGIPLTVKTANAHSSRNNHALF
jgi:hypothetical protein